MTKAVVILSGGMDSAVLLYWAKSEGYEPYTLSFDYGQRHKKEIGFAAYLSEKVGCDWQLANLGPIRDLLGSSSLTSDREVPQGHYAEENMKATVVPNRNMIMLSIASGYAQVVGAECVFFGGHSGDHPIYPDCRPEFILALDKAVELGNYNAPAIRGPFLQKTKADIVKIGANLGVDFEDTWSCYEGQTSHCGLCGTCCERREAFELAGVFDPTSYTATPAEYRAVMSRYTPKQADRENKEGV